MRFFMDSSWGKGAHAHGLDEVDTGQPLETQWTLQLITSYRQPDYPPFGQPPFVTARTANLHLFQPSWAAW